MNGGVLSQVRDSVKNALWHTHIEPNFVPPIGEDDHDSHSPNYESYVHYKRDMEAISKRRGPLENATKSGSKWSFRSQSKTALGSSHGIFDPTRSHSQDQSQFFRLLPVELRLKIYQYAFGCPDRPLHVRYLHRRFVHRQCQEVHNAYLWLHFDCWTEGPSIPVWIRRHFTSVVETSLLGIPLSCRKMFVRSGKHRRTSS